MISQPEPSIEDFEALAAKAFSELPQEFRDTCGNVSVQVKDLPDEETLRALGIASPFDLLGLYHGVSLNHQSVSDLPRGPEMVFLYRLPILEYWANRPESLQEIVTHVLVHEIGHHFGLSDEDMERIERDAG